MSSFEGRGGPVRYGDSRYAAPPPRAKGGKPARRQPEPEPDEDDDDLDGDFHDLGGEGRGYGGRPEAGRAGDHFGGGGGGYGGGGGRGYDPDDLIMGQEGADYDPGFDSPGMGGGYGHGDDFGQEFDESFDPWWEGIEEEVEDIGELYRRHMAAQRAYTAHLLARMAEAKAQGVAFDPSMMPPRRPTGWEMRQRGEVEKYQRRRAGAAAHAADVVSLHREGRPIKYARRPEPEREPDGYETWKAKQAEAARRTQEVVLRLQREKEAEQRIKYQREQQAQPAKPATRPAQRPFDCPGYVCTTI